MNFHILLYIRYLVITKQLNVMESEWAISWILELSKDLGPTEAYAFIINEAIP